MPAPRLCSHCINISSHYLSLVRYFRATDNVFALRYSAIHVSKITNSKFVFDSSGLPSSEWYRLMPCHQVLWFVIIIIAWLRRWFISGIYGEKFNERTFLLTIKFEILMYPIILAIKTYLTSNIFFFYSYGSKSLTVDLHNLYSLVLQSPRKELKELFSPALVTVASIL